MTSETYKTENWWIRVSITEHLQENRAWMQGGSLWSEALHFHKCPWRVPALSSSAYENTQGNPTSSLPNTRNFRPVSPYNKCISALDSTWALDPGLSWWSWHRLKCEMWFSVNWNCSSTPNSIILWSSRISLAKTSIKLLTCLSSIVCAPFSRIANLSLWHQHFDPRGHAFRIW